MVSTLASSPSCPGFESWLRKNFSDVAMLIDSKDSAKKLNMVDRTHPVLVKVVLQKKS